MIKSKCKICKKNYKSLAGDLCFYCDQKHWVIYWNKQFDDKDKK